MASKPGIRLSVEPLDAALMRKGIEECDLPVRILRTLWTARNRGYITLAMADEIACDILGEHPLFVWGHEYEANVWHDMDPDPAPLAQVIVLPVRRVVEVETRVLVAA